MACGARPGLKQCTDGRLSYKLLWRNGLWSPSGIVRLLTGESVTQKESCLSSDMRTERPASRSGTLRGGKPADNEPDLRARKAGKGASPVPSADERNLCLKRRQREVAKLAVTPRPKRQGGSLNDESRVGDCF